MSKPEQSAYDKGVDARVKNIDLKQNPYRPVRLNAARRSDWARGWRDWDEILRKYPQAHKASRDQRKPHQVKRSKQ